MKGVMDGWHGDEPELDSMDDDFQDDYESDHEEYWQNED